MPKPSSDISIMDTQIVELLGRNRLIDQLLRDGLEVALPERDRGIDLIAYADLDSKVRRFIARPIQMKAASNRSFAIEKKYEKFPDLLLAYVWNLSDEGQPMTFALTYPEAVEIASQMGWTKTSSWRDKEKYSNTRPGDDLCKLLIPFKMEQGKWWEKIVGNK